MNDYKTPRFGSKDIHTVIGELLRLGIIVSSVLVFAGGITFLIRHGGNLANYKVFHSEPVQYRSLSKILLGVMHWKGREVIQLGLIVLIATPTLRILLSLISFIIEKDRLYVAITLVVLAVIIFSMLSGIAS